MVKKLLTKQMLDRNTCEVVKEGNVFLKKCNVYYPLVYRDLDNDFLKTASSKNYSDGTTCLLALIMNCRLTVANVGDSSAILIRND